MKQFMTSAIEWQPAKHIRSGGLVVTTVICIVISSTFGLIMDYCTSPVIAINPARVRGKDGLVILNGECWEVLLENIVYVCGIVLYEC